MYERVCTYNFHSKCGDLGQSPFRIIFSGLPFVLHPSTLSSQMVNMALCYDWPIYNSPTPFLCNHLQVCPQPCDKMLVYFGFPFFASTEKPQGYVKIYLKRMVKEIEDHQDYTMLRWGLNMFIFVMIVKRKLKYKNQILESIIYLLNYLISAWSQRLADTLDFSLASHWLTWSSSLNTSFYFSNVLLISS